MSAPSLNGPHDIRLGLSCEFEMRGETLFTTWIPAAPKQLSATEIQRYRIARNRFLEDVAAQTGKRIAVVEL